MFSKRHQVQGLCTPWLEQSPKRSPWSLSILHGTNPETSREILTDLKLKRKKKVLVLIVIKKTIIFIAATYIRTVLPVYFFNKALKLDTFKIFLFSLSAGGAGKG